MKQALKDPFFTLLNDDVTFAGVIVKFVVEKTAKRYAWLIATMDSTIPSSVIHEATELIEAHNFYASLESELTNWEVQLSIENGGNHSMRNKENLILLAKKRLREKQIKTALKKIESSYNSEIEKDRIGFQAGLDTDYEYAQESTQTLINTLFARIDSGNTIPDDDLTI